MAPGPIYIHARHCAAWAGDGFPAGLRDLPLAFEVRAGESRVTTLTRAPGGDAEREITGLLDDENTGWLHLRHAEAGCFIARVERAA